MIKDKIHSVNNYSFGESDIIGSGNFSKVYKGRSTDDIDVAIKKMELGNKVNKDRKIEREISVISKISHINIIKVYDIIWDESISQNKILYIVMEYCNRGDIKNLEKPMKENVWKKYFKQILDGLFYLHQNKIYHRDLKPENILINDADIIKICDFTFSREFHDDEMINATLCGTPNYMAPEILLNNKYTELSDIWSLGVIMYQFIYGELPFGIIDTLPLLYQKLSKCQIDYPRYSNNGYFVSDPTIQIMTQMLRKRHNQRIKWEELINHPWIKKETNTSYDVFEKSIYIKQRPESVPMSIYTFGGPSPVITTNTPPIKMTIRNNTSNDIKSIDSNKSIKIGNNILDISEYNPTSSTSCPPTLSTSIKSSQPSPKSSNDSIFNLSFNVFKNIFG